MAALRGWMVGARVQGSIEELKANQRELLALLRAALPNLPPMPQMVSAPDPDSSEQGCVEPWRWR